MTLLEFIIKIKLQGAQAARDLGRIKRGADAAKDGLNRAGRAARGANSDLGKTAKAADKATGALAKLMRGVRMGGGLRIGAIGGFGVSVNPASLLGAASEAIAGLSAGAIAIGAAVATTVTAVVLFGKALFDALPEIQKQQTLEANAALAVPGNTVAEKRANMAALRKQAEAGLSRIVDGKDVLTGMPISEIMQLQGELMKAGVSLRDVLQGDLLESLAVIRRADPTADIDKLVEAIAYAGPLAVKSGLNIAEAANMTSAVAAATPYKLEEVAGALATVSPLAKSTGVNLNEMAAFMTMASGGFASAKQNATAMQNVLNKFTFTPKIKFVEELEAKHNITYRTKDGAIKNILEIDAMLRDLKQNVNQADFDKYLLKRFDKNGKRFWLEVLSADDEARKQAFKIVQSGGSASEFAALMRAESIEGAKANRAAASEEFAAAADELGVDSMSNWWDNWMAGVSRAAAGMVRGEKFKYEGMDFGVRNREKDTEPKAGKKKAAAAPRQTAKTVAASKQAAAETKALQASVIADAGKIESAHKSAQQKAQMFAPLLRAAEGFAKALPLWVRSARLGVQSELLMMVNSINAMASKFEMAGHNVSSSFARGFNAGTATLTLPTPSTGSTVYNDNRKTTVNGATPKQVQRTAQKAAGASTGKKSSRRGGAR